MFELLIAASALSLIIMIFRKQARIIEQKRPVDWGMAGHVPEAAATQASNENTSTAKSELNENDGDVSSLREEPLDFQSINKYLREAETHFARGEFDEAEKDFIKVLSYQDDHPEALNKLSVIYIQSDDIRKAELMLNKLMGTNTKDPTHFCNYGRCLYSLGRKEDAVTAYLKAIELDPSKPSRHVNVANIYYELENLVQSLEYYQRALELDPYNPEYLSIIVDLAEQTGEPEIQYKTLKKMLDIDPYNYEAKRKFDAIAKSIGR